MEKDRSAKIIAMVALFIAVVGLSIGFADYTRNLTISASAHVTASQNDFSVKFSKVDQKIEKGTVEGTSSDGASQIDTATINERTISGLGGTFSAPNQSITYDFYVGNDGQYDAFLKSVTFADISGQKTSIKCTAISNTSQSLVDAACQGFEIEVIHDPEGDNEHSWKETDNAITDHKLAIGDYEKIRVVIRYLEGSSRADGDFNVEFGDITMHYSTVDE